MVSSIFIQDREKSQYGPYVRYICYTLWWPIIILPCFMYDLSKKIFVFYYMSLNKTNETLIFKDVCYIKTSHKLCNLVAKPCMHPVNAFHLIVCLLRVITYQLNHHLCCITSEQRTIVVHMRRHSIGRCSKYETSSRFTVILLIRRWKLGVSSCQLNKCWH